MIWGLGLKMSDLLLRLSTDKILRMSLDIET